MKVVILAGGMGTRISEESHLKPKPMIEIGEKPILWHIMKIYGHYGCRDFVICLGYKSYVIKEFFEHFFLHNSDVTFDFQSGQEQKIIHNYHAEPWSITLVETGRDTLTGGRVKRVRSYLDEQPFLLTYGDGVGDVDIGELVKFHKSHGKLATVTATQPSGRFGSLALSGTNVTSFQEKPKGDGAWINGGFFVMQPEVLDYIEGDDTVLEREPLERLAREGQLMAYKHHGFWQPMDTLRDKNYLEDLWKSGLAKWKVW
jgi:glucose-1-phosphate cytidylyltransferase